MRADGAAAAAVAGVGRVGGGQGVAELHSCTLRGKAIGEDNIAGGVVEPLDEQRAVRLKVLQDLARPEDVASEDVQRLGARLGRRRRVDARLRKRGAIDDVCARPALHCLPSQQSDSGS